jgi:hypothetical protein
MLQALKKKRECGWELMEQGQVIHAGVKPYWRLSVAQL